MTCPICSGSGERDGEYGLLSCDAPNCTAATERAALEAANKAAEPMTVYDQRWFAYSLGKEAKWTSSDTKPVDELVWACWNGAGTWHHEARQGLARYLPNLGWQPQGSMGWDWNVTHWMPLPSIPE